MTRGHATVFTFRDGARPVGNVGPAGEPDGLQTPGRGWLRPPANGGSFLAGLVKPFRRSSVWDVPIYALGDLEPTIDPTAYVHPEAVIIGNVTVGANSSIWPCAVLRGDDGSITIGARTSIQDGAVVHTTEFTPTTVGDDCTVGHLAHLEGCTIENGSLVGTASVVLHRAVVGPGSLVAANAVVLNDQIIPPGALAMGVPAKVREGAADQTNLTESAQSYVTRAERFRTTLRRLD